MFLYDKKRMTDVAVVGGKSVGLAKLIEYGWNVPDFFVITAGTKIDVADFAAELATFAEKLNCNTFAVRSSSINEDAEEGSFAGQFSTILDVPRDKLLQAVRNVVSSCGNRRAKNYSEHFNTRAGEVAVIVQKQLHGDYSGVLFTTSPYNDDERIIETVRGLGESLVSGTASPEGRIFKKGERSNHNVYQNLLDVADVLEKREGKALDIEWTCYKDQVWFLQMRPLTALGDSLPSISNRQWRMYVYRDFCLFAHGIQRIASLPEVQEKLFGFSLPISEGLIVNGREFYSPQSDRHDFELWKRLDKEEFFEEFIKSIKRSVANTRRRVKNLKSTDCCKLSTVELFALYRREIKAYVKSYVPLMMRPDDYLFEKLTALVGEDRAEEIVGAVSISGRKTYYAQEHGKFLSAIAGGDIAAYLRDYEWMGSPLGKTCVTIDEVQFSKRASGITRFVAKEKLRELSSLHKKDMEYKDKILAKLSGEEKKYANLVEEFIYLRTYTTENSDRYFYYIRKYILENIAKRLHMDIDVLLLMSPEEVWETQNGYALSAREIAKRKSGEVVVLSNGISKVYYTGKSYTLLKQLLPNDNAKGAILEGKVACMGEVRAKVKIVNHMQQADDFEEGCILVTTMTTPEITSAIERASGIITDEGGITCHAAIIAREYSVPCLVGTKNATSVLKDGVTVKLDCINGRVTIEK